MPCDWLPIQNRDSVLVMRCTEHSNLVYNNMALSCNLYMADKKPSLYEDKTIN